MSKKARLSMEIRCRAEASSMGFSPELGSVIMNHYLDEFLLGQPVSDAVFEARFFHNIYKYAESFDSETDNRLHQVYTEIHNAVTNYLAYVKHTSEEELLSGQR